MARKPNELAGLGLGMGLAALGSMLSSSVKCTTCEHSFKAKVKKECSTCDNNHSGEADTDDIFCWQCNRREVYFEPNDHWRPKQ